MIAWRKFNGDESLPEIVERAGMKSERESNKIIVLVKFDSDWDNYEPRFSHVGIFHAKLKLIPEGMTGKVIISHWSEINKPKIV